MIPLTAPVVGSGSPEAFTSVNEPVSTKPPLWFGAVAVTGRVGDLADERARRDACTGHRDVPASVATIELSAIVELPAAGALALASVRAPGTLLPPPSRQVPAGCAGTVWATQSLGRSM